MNAPLPQIIQGGMGVAVSSWRLARAVAQRGQLGVVSGTGLDTVVARRLQLGDPDGHLRQAFDAFPVPEIATRVWNRYYVEGGKATGAAFKSKAVPSIKMPSALLDLIVLSNFAEVFLAKAQHAGQVGINLLEKVQLPNLASLLGAMLAKVDYVLMGAGIPRAIPAILDRFAAGDTAEMALDVAGAQPGEKFYTRLDPRRFFGDALSSLKRPDFLAIVSSSTLALTLARKSQGKVNGFVVEGPTAGGHNAPPRGAMTLDDKGEPIYGLRDSPDLEQIRALGLPFWMAGSYGGEDRLQHALSLGASGIQVGTAFAFCEESGLPPRSRHRCGGEPRKVASACSPTRSPRRPAFRSRSCRSRARFPSPTCMPLARASATSVTCARTTARKTARWVTGARPSRSRITSTRAATEADIHGRKCLCNGLLSAVDTGRCATTAPSSRRSTRPATKRPKYKFVRPGHTSYTADDVIDRLLGLQPA